MPRKFSTKKLTDLPLTSGYFNPEPHGPTKGYVEDPAIKYILNERKRNNEDFKDQLLFDKLDQDYQKWLKENNGRNQNQIKERSTPIPNQENQT